jgi:hypothetical protein
VIDGWLEQGTWPTAVQEAVALFEQGDLVERPPFFYIGSARYGIWRFTREVGDAELPNELFELDSEDAPLYGMITTETCDLVEETSRPRQPWISVAPVFRLENLDANSVNLLRNKRVAYMRQLTSPQFAGEPWVVDVRIEFPIEKSWLVGREPIPGFSSTEEKKELATFLAGRRDRPVLAGELHEWLLTPMRRWLERLSSTKREQVLAGIKEVRLAISGDPLRPDGAALLIIAESEPLSPNVVETWDGKWATWREGLERANIALLPNEYTDLDKLRARTYNDSFRIPLQFVFG